MNWMNKLERKFGRYAIPGITRYLIFANLIGYLLAAFSNVLPFSDLMSYLDFSAAHIFHGQIWRLVTWIFVPSSGLSIWSLLFIVCLLMLGQNLEQWLGTFRMNVYFIGGILISDVGGLLINVITYALGIRVSYYNMESGLPIYLTMYYILFSLYLMLGLFMPEAEVRLYFVLPIKMKWLMVVYVLTLGFEIISYFRVGWMYGVIFSSEIIFAIINLLIFVYSCKSRVSFKQRKRTAQFKAQFAEPRPGSGITKHKCAICGRTEQDDPNLTFRYCSKCAGNYEYCQDHLFTHTHVQSM